MPNTYSLIASSTVGSGGAASIDFNSIPQTYTDLIVMCSLRTSKSDALDTGLVKINGVSTNLSNISLIAADSTTISADYTTSRMINGVDASTATTSTFSTHSIYFPNYTSATYKSFSAEGATENNGAGYTERGIMTNLWSSTAAITSLTIYSSTNFVQYSSAYLYGIKKS